jgi:hypothetical protein
MALRTGEKTRQRKQSSPPVFTGPSEDWFPADFNSISALRRGSYAASILNRQNLIYENKIKSPTATASCEVEPEW